MLIFKKILQRLLIFSSIATLLLFLSCATVPITGRQQFSFIPASSMLSMSLQQYETFLQNNKLSSNLKQRQTVNRIGKRIQKAVEQYFAEQKMSSELENYMWEFNLIENKSANAWCMPGGKVAVYTGILPITQDDDGLAVVLSHEIAHAVAGHGSERMSQALAVQMGGLALSAALATQSSTTTNLWMAVFGLGAQVGIILPYSRLHEYEADYLGMVFMAKAGYNPSKAVDFWKRMSREKKETGGPDFLSTHPSDENRIRNIKFMLSDAMRYYVPNKTQ